MWLRCAGLRTPIEFDGCENLLPILRQVLGSWSFAAVVSGEGETPIRLSRLGEGYRLESPWLEEAREETDPVTIVCAFVVDLVRALAEDDRSLLCLHCAAAAYGDRLVLFPNWYRAGKSLLMARLAAQGRKIWADDVMPITASGAGMSLGLAPRLRLPLPSAADDCFRGFVESAAGPRNHRYLYLDLPESRLARFGACLPLGAVVLLDRQEGVPARLEGLPRGESMRRIILQNFARSGPATDILLRVRQIAEGCPCYKLTYADLEEAASLLENRFASGEGFARRSDESAIESPQDRQITIATTERRQNGEKPEESYLRVPDVVCESTDGAAFLVDPAQNRIYHLNPVGAALWTLLAEPVSAREAAAVLHNAFPEESEGRILEDIRGLLDRLHSNGLIRRAD